LKGEETFSAECIENGINVDNLGKQPFLPWVVFAEAVSLLVRNGGRALRGDAMNARLGDEKLPFNSVEGHIAHVVYGQKKGDSVFRRITPVSCILIWAGICEHAPGELLLSNQPLLTITLKEKDLLQATVSKLSSLKKYLSQTVLNLEDHKLESWYKTVTSVKHILGNFDNDISFIACLMAKHFLVKRHNLPVVDVATKPQSAPGLDIDETALDGKRIIAEVKTTIPYHKDDLGAQQRASFLKDFKKLSQNSAEYKYFFVTEPETFRVVRRRYHKHLKDVTLVLLPQAMEDDSYIVSLSKDEEVLAADQKLSGISAWPPEKRTVLKADSIREFINSSFFEPARKDGLNQLTLKSGEIHKRMNLHNRYPLVCSAMRGQKIERQCNVKIVKVEGSDGANLYVTYALL